MAIPNRISTTVPAATVTDALARINEGFNLLKPFLLATLICYSPIFGQKVG